eukprot:ctg_6834.g531
MRTRWPQTSACAPAPRCVGRAPASHPRSGFGGVGARSNRSPRGSRGS